MFHYPQLTPTEQAALPKLLALPTAMPSKFEDSTHQLWHCQTTQGDMVLKVCSEATIVKSDFWFGMNDLFAADFPQSLDKAKDTYRFMQKNGLLLVPDLIACQAKRFVLTRFLVGEDLEANSIENTCENSWVIQLANHIARLHQHAFSHWGNFQAPQFTAQEWSERLYKTLVHLASQRLGIVPKLDISDPQLNDILTQAKTITETEFVPIMLDLRWDQLRCLKGLEPSSNLALIDLDAFAIGPRSLELVLLSYILTPAQYALFKTHYTMAHPWPDHANQKQSYQLLLFLMNVLGETNLAHWLSQSDY